MEQYMWIVWLAVFVLAVIIEATTAELVSIFFAIGSALTLVISFIPGVTWWIELIVFVVVSAASLLALRPVFKHLLKRNIFKSNVDSFQGKRGYVVEDITYLIPGAVKMGDVKWSAVPQDKNTTFLKGEVVEVVSINGNKLIVKKVEEKK